MPIKNWSDSLAEHLQNYQNVLLVISKGGANRGYYSKIQDNFESKSVSVIEDVPTLPDLDYVEKLFNDFKGMKFDCIVGIGGGSVLDITKALKVIINMSSLAKFDKNFFDGEIDLDLSTPDLILSYSMVINTTISKFDVDISESWVENLNFGCIYKL